MVADFFVMLVLAFAAFFALMWVQNRQKALALRTHRAQLVNEHLNKAVEQWHESKAAHPIHEALDMTEAEYEAWVLTADPEPWIQRRLKEMP